MNIDSRDHNLSKDAQLNLKSLTNFHYLCEVLANIKTTKRTKSQIIMAPNRHEHFESLRSSKTSSINKGHFEASANWVPIYCLTLSGHMYL